MIGPNCLIAWVVLSFGFLVALAPGHAQTAEDQGQAARAIVTVIHLAADGSYIIRGNGFLIAGDGTLVTNFHIVSGASRLQIKLANGDVYDQVNLRAVDPLSDLAVLKIPAFNVPHVPLAAEARPAAGESLQVSCQPSGSGAPPVRPVTVTAPFRLASGLEGFAFQPGLDALSKGCPVLNAAGECVGITTLALRSYVGEGIAIGISRLHAVLARQMNRPLDLVDWSSWPSGPDSSVASELQTAGLRATPPPADIRTEKSLRRRLELSLEFDPTDLQARALLARAYIQDRAYAEAEAQIETLLAQRPDWLEALTLRGDLLCHTGDYEGARETYSEIVGRGFQPPHNYNKERAGVKLHDVSHDHALDICVGVITLAEETLDFQPGFGSDGFSVDYGRIRKVEVKLEQKPGDIRYNFSFYFDRPIPNRLQTWNKDEIELRVPDLETGQNLAGYLRNRGLDVQDKH